MYDWAVLTHWAEFAVRWVHVITAIAWIGSSFYFIALDLGLHRDRALASGADGEEWQVHGGGFYHVQKYLVAPERMPGDLVWFKWESYSTWASGFGLRASGVAIALPTCCRKPFTYRSPSRIAPSASTVQSQSDTCTSIG